jgi:type II secretory pathway pseudopilin PulG
MPLRRLRQLRTQEGGFALIEVLISALIVVLVTAAVVQTLTATGRASTEERHRAQAFSVAQEDQARLRAMQISTLQQGLPPRTVTVDGTPFTVTSTATYVSAKTGGTQCGGEGRADYVRIGSSVTWPTMHEGAAPVSIESIVSPISGSVDATSGGLAVTLLNSRDEGIPGVPISGSGPATFFGSTNSEGCALFGGQPTGKYTITANPAGTEWVDVNGEVPQPFNMEVTGGTTASKELHYDHAGHLTVKYSVRSRETGTPVAAKTDSFIVTNPEMTTARAFGTLGTMTTELKSKALYPFKSGYSVYAGSCTPAIKELEPESGARQYVEVPPGGSPETVVQLPALYLTVRSSKGTAPEQTAVSGAKVTLRDLNCKNAKKELVVREYTTTAIGSLAEKATPTFEAAGVPTGEYEVCASKGGRRVTAPKPVLVKSVGGTLLTLDLTGTESTTGKCP